MVEEGLFRTTKRLAQYFVLIEAPSKITFVPYWNSLQNKIKKY
jgi:hypothetical protein